MGYDMICYIYIYIYIFYLYIFIIVCWSGLGLELNGLGRGVRVWVEIFLSIFVGFYYNLIFYKSYNLLNIKNVINQKFLECQFLHTS